MALSFEQIAEFAQSLRDDPTFDTMGEASRHVEARFLVGAAGDNADVTAVVEMARDLEQTPPSIGQRVRSHIPGNDRVEPPAPAKRKADAPPIAETAITSSGRRLPLLYEIKAATGASDRELSDLLAVPRSTIQAIVAGRSPEMFNKVQMVALSQFVDRTLAAVTAVRATLIKN